MTETKINKFKTKTETKLTPITTVRKVIYKILKKISLRKNKLYSIK